MISNTLFNHNPQQNKSSDIYPTKSSDQLNHDSSDKKLETSDMCFNSSCGEINQLMKSNTSLNHNLQQSKSSAAIQDYKTNTFKNSTTSPNITNLLIPNREASTQQHILQPMLEQTKGISRSYHNTTLDTKHEPKSEYVPSIDPEPPAASVLAAVSTCSDKT